MFLDTINVSPPPPAAKPLTGASSGTTFRQSSKCGADGGHRSDDAGAGGSDTAGDPAGAAGRGSDSRGDRIAVSDHCCFDIAPSERAEGSGARAVGAGWPHDRVFAGEHG